MHVDKLTIDSTPKAHEASAFFGDVALAALRASFRCATSRVIAYSRNIRHLADVSLEGAHAEWLRVAVVPTFTPERETDRKRYLRGSI